jgi:alpha-L-rhamnosidase
MGDGWYKGRIGLLKDGKQDDLWGSEYKLCAHIVIKLKNGKEIHYETDETWKVKSSNEIFNNIYDGEIVDYTKKEESIQNVVISKENYNLIPDFGALIIQKDILYPELYISPKNETILDFKQNMVGFVRFKGFLKYNQSIKMSHGEILQNKCFFNQNLRTAKQVLKFKGDGYKRIYEPKFTYFGFRYVLVKGLDVVNPKDFEGVVIYSDLEKTINCTTDNPKINKLIQNAYWGQRGNFLDVPTDCPQRDERLVWTGDTQVFSNTGCYNMDSYIFYK